MGDSTLSGTNKQDQGGNLSERDPKREKNANTNLQQRQGQQGGTSASQPTVGKGQTPSSKNGSQKEPDSKTDEQHIRSITTPPGEPYNDPKVRGH